MAEQRFMSIAAELRDQVLGRHARPGRQAPDHQGVGGFVSLRWSDRAAALGQLVVEGVVRTSPRGSFVADEAPVSLSPAERAVLARRTGSILAEGETAVVTAAEMVVPPLYVSEIFDLDHGDQVVRREYVVGRSRTRSMLAVDWFPAHFAAQVPDLFEHRTRKSAGPPLQSPGNRRAHSHVRPGRHARARGGPARGPSPRHPARSTHTCRGTQVERRGRHDPLRRVVPATQDDPLLRDGPGPRPGVSRLLRWGPRRRRGWPYRCSGGGVMWVIAMSSSRAGAVWAATRRWAGRCGVLRRRRRGRARDPRP